jgi:hypothetical protein
MLIKMIRDSIMIFVILAASSNMAWAEVMTLDCGGDFYVIDFSAGTVTDTSNGPYGAPLTQVVISDSEISFVMDNGAYRRTSQISRVSGMLTVQSVCLPGGCSSIGQRQPVHCTKAPNKQF